MTGDRESSNFLQESSGEMSPPAGRACQQLYIGDRVEILLDGQNECPSGAGSLQKFRAIRVLLPSNSAEEMAFTSVKAD